MVFAVMKLPCTRNAHIVLCEFTFHQSYERFTLDILFCCVDWVFRLCSVRRQVGAATDSFSHGAIYFGELAQASNEIDKSQTGTDKFGNSPRLVHFAYLLR